MVYVANPLYDAVFKYLMEDERIAKTILSALLQKEVLEVKMRRNEYSNINRNAISMFRIDFAAKVKEKDGSQKLILIELQKTWLETETLRFRQYLALQYNNKENMTKESDNKYALPTIAVYLLGHRVGEINEPVVYAQHRIYDYEGKEVVLDQPDPFVESLQHDSSHIRLKDAGICHAALLLFSELPPIPCSPSLQRSVLLLLLSEFLHQWQLLPLPDFSKLPRLEVGSSLLGSYSY